MAYDIWGNAGNRKIYRIKPQIDLERELLPYVEMNLGKYYRHFPGYNRRMNGTNLRRNGRDYWQAVDLSASIAEKFLNGRDLTKELFWSNLHEACCKKQGETGRNSHEINVIKQLPVRRKDILKHLSVEAYSKYQQLPEGPLYLPEDLFDQYLSHL